MAPGLIREPPLIDGTLNAVYVPLLRSRPSSPAREDELFHSVVKDYADGERRSWISFTAKNLGRSGFAETVLGRMVMNGPNRIRTCDLLRVRQMSKTELDDRPSEVGLISQMYELFQMGESSLRGSGQSLKAVRAHLILD